MKTARHAIELFIDGESKGVTVVPELADEVSVYEVRARPVTSDEDAELRKRPKARYDLDAERKLYVRRDKK